MKTLAFLRDHLLPAGAVLFRKDGDHHIYKLPTGRMFALPVGGQHTEAKPYLLPKLRRLLREEPRR